MRKKILSLTLALALCLGLAVPAFAAESPKITWLPEGICPARNPEAETIEPFQNGVLTIYAGSFTPGEVNWNEVKYGLVDKTGKLVAPTEYGWIERCSDDGSIIAYKDGVTYFIDQNGQVLGLTMYNVQNISSEGLYLADDWSWPDHTDNRKYGFIDQTGRLVIPLEYDEARNFSGGLAAVRKNDKWGFVDKTGTVVIPLEYDDVSDFKDGLAVVCKNNSWDLLDNTGKAVLSLGSSYQSVGLFTEGMAVVYGWNGKYGAINRSGQLVVPLDYDILNAFSDGLSCAGKISGVDVYGDPTYKFGFLDTSGRTVIPLEYDIVADPTSDQAPFYGNYSESAFFKGMAGVGKSESGENNDYMWGFIDKTNKVVIPLEYNSIERSFDSDTVWLLNRDYKASVMDLSGNLLIPLDYNFMWRSPKYGDSGVFFDDIAAVSKNGKWGYMDRSGKILLPLEYDEVSYASGGMGVVRQGSRYGIVDLNTSAPLAHATDQSITVDGRPVAFQTYALLDDNGYGTNYVKLRDIAHILNGTGAQFSVDYSPEAGISITTGTAYQDVGTEMTTPFAGADKTYLRQDLTLPINGVSVSLDAITLLDDNGGGYNYFKLRDLGQALNFFVDWDGSTSTVVLDTSRGHETTPAPDNGSSAMARAMLDILDLSSEGSACLSDVDGDGVKELIVLEQETARLYDWSNGQLTSKQIGVLAGGQLDWLLCLDTATGALGIEFQATGASYETSTFYYPDREFSLGRSFSDDGSFDQNFYRVNDQPVSQAEYNTVRAQNCRVELLLSDMDNSECTAEAREELELLAAGKTARDISDAALLRIAQRLEWDISSMSISIMNGWPTECDYSDSIPVDIEGGGMMDYYRVIGYTSVDDVVRATETLWYRKVSRPDPAAELAFASNIRERYIVSGGALYRHDLGMGDGGIVGIIDHMVSRTGDRAVFSGYSTYDGEENLGDFQIALVYEDGDWKYCAIDSAPDA